MTSKSIFYTTMQFILLTALIFCLVSFAVSPASVLGNAEILAAAVSASAIIMLSMIKIRKNRADFEKESDLSSVLSTAMFYNSSGMSLQKSLEFSINGKDADVDNAVSYLSRRIRMGMQLGDAFGSVDFLRRSKLYAAASSYITPDAISSLISMRELSLETMLSKLESSVQRYSTICMFTAVLLPSFALFAFIGSSLLGSSTINIEMLCITLLCVLPAVYALGSMTISKGLNG